jgi:hypothetical protein
MAGQMLAKPTATQSATMSFDPARSYASNWGDDIKVEIPKPVFQSANSAAFCVNDWAGELRFPAHDASLRAPGREAECR